MTQKEILDQALAGLKAIKNKVDKEFYYQEEEVLNHKPAPEKWSASQCFEHINLTNRFYIDHLKKALNNNIQDSAAYNKSFKSGYVGGYMIKSMQPKNGVVSNKMKTFSGIRPLAERHEGAVVKAQKVFADFLADLKEMQDLIEAYRTYNIQKAKVPSMVGNVLKFRVGDAFLFLNAHTNRHVVQALNAMGCGYDIKN